jgi:hypothetical protein
MALRDEDQEIDCRIIESYGIFSQGIRFWNKEVNLVSWNGRPAKLDIRTWQRDHAKCGKGIALTREEAENLVKLLNEILKPKYGAEKKRQASARGDTARGNAARGAASRDTSAERSRATKKPEVPKTLEPFYKELKLEFGAGPDECKTARNTLLQKYHPDKNAGKILSATRKTIKIKEAYEKIIAWWKAEGGV